MSDIFKKMRRHYEYKIRKKYKELGLNKEQIKVLNKMQREINKKSKELMLYGKKV